MSGDWDGEAAVWNERKVKARKPHVCSACSEAIPAGATYVRNKGESWPARAPVGGAGLRGVLYLLWLE
jgi:hypothetical protein